MDAAVLEHHDVSLRFLEARMTGHPHTSSDYLNQFALVVPRLENVDLSNVPEVNTFSDDVGAHNDSYVVFFLLTQRIDGGY